MLFCSDKIDPNRKLRRKCPSRSNLYIFSGESSKSLRSCWYRCTNRVYPKTDVTLQSKQMFEHSKELKSIQFFF